MVPDSETDLEDELPSPDGSPMVISHGVSHLPARLEEDVDLAQILAEFVTLPAIVTPIHDPQEMRVMPPAECRPPEALADVVVTPAGPADDDGRPPTGSVGCSPGAPAAPAVPTLERNLMYQDRRRLVRHLGERRRIIEFRQFPCRPVRQQCANPWTNWIHFGSRRTSLICRARGPVRYLSGPTPV